MAQYEKHVWATGDLITPERMNNIENGIERINEGTILDSIAQIYDEEQTYAKGEYVIYNNKLYSISANGTTGVWDDSYGQEISVTDLILQLNGIVTQQGETTDGRYNTIKDSIAYQFSELGDYHAGDYVYYRDVLYHFNSEHSSSDFNPSQVNEVQLTTELNNIIQNVFGDAYSSTSSYEVEDFMTIGNILYRCIEDSSGGEFSSNYQKFQQTTIGKELTRTNRIGLAAEDYALRAEAYGAGTREGQPLTSADPYGFENNAKYFSNNSKQFSEDAEAFATGFRNGVEITDTEDPAYNKNARYYSQQASLATPEGYEEVLTSAVEMIEQMSSALSNVGTAITNANTAATSFAPNIIASTHDPANSYVFGNYVVKNNDLYFCYKSVEANTEFSTDYFLKTNMTNELILSSRKTIRYFITAMDGEFYAGANAFSGGSIKRIQGTTYVISGTGASANADVSIEITALSSSVTTNLYTSGTSRNVNRKAITLLKGHTYCLRTKYLSGGRTNLSVVPPHGRLCRKYISGEEGQTVLNSRLGILNYDITTGNCTNIFTYNSIDAPNGVYVACIIEKNAANGQTLTNYTIEITLEDITGDQNKLDYIAPAEFSPTIAAHYAGDLIIYNEKLCKLTTNVSIGTTLTNSMYTITSIAAELKNYKLKED